MEVREPKDWRRPGIDPCTYTAAREYRVSFWEQPFPPDDLPATQEMGWGECTVDLADIQDVQEAIEWVETHFREFSPYGGQPVRARTYVMFAKVPGEERFLQIAGIDPSIAEGAFPGDNLVRVRPLPAG